MQNNSHDAHSIEPIKRYDTLAERAYEQLRHALVSGSFRPGQKVTIRKMAAVLGVSATPAREAINRLVAEGVLETDASRSVLVPTLDLERLKQIYILRVALEGLATELGAENISANDIAKLERVQMSLIGAMDRNDYRQVLIDNETFHFSIYKASNLEMLVDAISQLWLKLGPSLNLLYPSYNSSRKGVSHHLNIVDALRRGDAAGARKEMENDLQDGFLELQAAIVASE